MISSPGESDSGPGASTPDEPVPGQTHDHPQRRNVQEGWTDGDCQHSPLPHQAELFPCHPGSGGKLPASTQTYASVAPKSVSPTPHWFSYDSSGRGLRFQSKHQRCVCAEIPKCPLCLAGRGRQWRGDGGRQSCGEIPGWQPQPGVWGQGAW